MITDWVKWSIQEDLSSRELAELLDDINHLLHNSDFEIIDQFYVDSNVSTMNTLVMTTFLRFPFSVRQYLPNWQFFLDRCEEEVLRRGDDPLNLFKGLYK